MSVVTEPTTVPDVPPVPERDSTALDRMRQRWAAIVAAVAGGLAVVTAVLGLVVLAR